MSVGCSEATIVKEEYEILEYDVDLKEGLATEGTFDELRSKCGEVFLGHRGGGFIFVCAQCQQTFSDFHCFGEHIRDEHPIFDIETILPVTVDGDMPPPKVEPLDQHTSDFGLHGGEPSEDLAKMEVIEDGAHCKDDDHPEESHSGTSKENCRTFSCKSCDCTFFEFESYLRHYTSQHPDIEIDNDFGSEMCKYCLQTFNDPLSYHSHMENAHSNELYSCPYCPKFFTQRVQRNYHVDIHEGKKPHKCPHCPSAFSRRNNLSQHVRFIHTNISLQFTCRFCDKKFKRKPDQKRHEKLHTGERTVECNECDMKFRNKNHLRDHMRESNHSNKLYICPYCPKSFTRSYDKNIHVDTHEGRKPHKCPHCPSAFARRSTLINHDRYIHKTISLQLFTCRFCDKKFKRKSDQKRHEKLHTGERTVGCSECAMKFRDNRQLRSHMLQHDRTQKNYKCPHCDSAFLCLTRLEEHLLTHRDERPFNAIIEEHIETKDKSLSQSVPEENFPSPKSEPDGEEADS